MKRKKKTMKDVMGPPPPRNPSASSFIDARSNSSESKMDPPTSATAKVTMGPPPPKNPSSLLPKTDASSQEEAQTTTPEEIRSDTQQKITPEEEPQSDHISTLVTNSDEKATENPEPKPSTDSVPRESANVAVPYTIPPWSERPCHPFSLEVLKDGLIIGQFDVTKKGAYMFGRVDLCDFVLDHPTISRFHAVLQFKQSGDAYIYDLGSTHGTSINKKQVMKRVYTELHVGDVIRFGLSSRLYIFQGPSELMPPERDLNEIRRAKLREEIQDRDASLQRAKHKASLADGISWGMAEDAIEEAEEDTEEVTWQTFTGQLTERQEKTREKIIKRTEKIANMKKEIDAIRSKDIAQGGLTQGQQTQIARNEQRMSQILEELESLEETLNESIQESMGARSGKTYGKKKGAVQDEDEEPSDDDEFYDRTKKKSSSQKVGEQSVETADTLLDKKDAIVKEMEGKSKLLLVEKSRIPEIEAATESGDALDAYMTGLSSQLVIDAATQLQQDLSALQSELDRIVYLLKIADPAGEAAKKRDSNLQASEFNLPNVTSVITKPLPKEKKKISTPEKPKPILKEESPNVAQATKPSEDNMNAIDDKESKYSSYTVTKPLWLGAKEDVEMKEAQPKESPVDIQDSDHFVDYKDRKMALDSVDDAKVNVSTRIEDAAPGLILRKRKHAEKLENNSRDPETSSSLPVEAGTAAADAVALLLKHKRGYFASNEGERNESIRDGVQSKEDTKSKRVLGPERPNFLDDNPDYETWVPPQGQSGDGRTLLNDRYGY